MDFIAGLRSELVLENIYIYILQSGLIEEVNAQL